MKKTVFDIEVYDQAPKDFCPQVEIAACYLEIEDKVLLLQCGAHKSEAGKWGVPAGKIEQGETPQQAAIRELFEETGIVAEPPSQIHYVGRLYMRKPTLDYVYHLFQVTLDLVPAVCLSLEHLDYKWASMRDWTEVPLMVGAKEGIDCYRKNSEKKGKRGN